MISIKEGLFYLTLILIPFFSREDTKPINNASNNKHSMEIKITENSFFEKKITLPAIIKDSTTSDIYCRRSFGKFKDSELNKAINHYLEKRKQEKFGYLAKKSL